MDHKTSWRFLLLWNFFGLSDEYLEGSYQEMFYLKYYGGFSLFETYNLPIQLRRWFMNKLSEQLTKESEEIKKANKK